jgi:MFS family permease
LAQSWLILVLVDPVTRAQVFAHGGDAAAAATAHASPAAEAAANYYSGVVGFAGGIPVTILTLFAGVVIDRVNKRRMLLVTQFMMMALAFSLGLLIRLGVVTIIDVIIVATLLGITMAFDMPTRQSFVVEMVSREDLPSAIPMNASMFNSARALGPAVAGLLLSAHVSLADCFFWNAASYSAVIAGILMMRGKNLGAPPKRPEGVARAEQKLFDELKAGLRYVRDDHTARNLVILVGTFGLFAFSFNVLIPTFVRYTLLAHATDSVQVKAFGFLEMVRGLGALVGALSVAMLTSPERQKKMLITGSLLATSVLVVFGFARSVPIAYICMTIVSYAFVLCFSNANTLMQMTVPDSLRGRVMAIYTLMFIGTGPIGSLLAGYLAKYFGAPSTIVCFAVVSLLIALVVCFRPGGLRALKTVEHHVPPASRAPQPAAGGD